MRWKCILINDAGMVWLVWWDSTEICGTTGQNRFQNSIEILVYLKFHSSEIRRPNQNKKENGLFWVQNFIYLFFLLKLMVLKTWENQISIICYGMGIRVIKFKCEFKTVLTPICVAALAHLVWPKFVMQIRPVVWSHFHFIHIYSPGAALKSHDRRQTLT